MSHPLTRLVARYGPDHGLYLYGEWCLLLALGYDAFLARHTPAQLASLAAQLGPLQLWPAASPDDPGGGEPFPAGEGADATPDTLAAVATDLAGEPLRLACGIDLFHAIGAWAAAGGVAPGAWFEPSRTALTEALGFVPPLLSLGLDPGLPAHGYRLLIWREAVLEGEVHPGLDLVIGPSDAPTPPLPYPWSPDPTGPRQVAWMPVGPASEPPGELLRVHWLVAIDRHLTASLPGHADKLVTPTVVQALLLEAERAGYDHELERYVSIPELRLVFQVLLRQGLPLKPIAPMLEAMLGMILADLAGRALTPPDIERLQRQLPMFPTGKLVGTVRTAIGLAPEPASGDAARLARMAQPLAAAPEPAQAPADPAVQAAWHALAGVVAATRSEAGRLAAQLRATDATQGRGVWGVLDAFAPPPDGPICEKAVAALAVDAQIYAAAREAWLGWGRAADVVLRSAGALTGQGGWPPGADAPERPDWRWALERPGALLRDLAGDT